MIKTLSLDLQKIYNDMQKCKSCRLVDELQINKPRDGHWRLHGWGRETDLVFVGMNPSSKRSYLVKPDMIPWLYVLEQGKEFNDTYLHYALRELGWCDCNNKDECNHKWFVTNIVKCYTEGQKLNGQYKDCIEACFKANLLEELKVLKPKAVILLGGIVAGAFRMKIGDIKTSDKVIPFFENARYGSSLKEYGVNSVFGSIYHPKFWVDPRQSYEGKSMNRVSQKTKTEQYASDIGKILDKAGISYRKTGS